MKGYKGRMLPCDECGGSVASSSIRASGHRFQGDKS